MSAKSGHGLPVRLFSVENYVVLTDGTTASVYSSDLNWKLTSQFSIFDYAKSPTAIEVVNLNISNATPQKEVKTPKGTPKNSTATQKNSSSNSRPLLCIGTVNGSVVFVCFRSTEKSKQLTNYELKNEQKNGKTVSPISCMHNNGVQLHIGHENGQVTSANLNVDINSNKLSYQTMKCHDRNIFTITSSLCNKYLATAVGTEVSVWEISSKQILKTCNPFQVDVTSLRFVCEKVEIDTAEPTPKRKRLSNKNLMRTSALVAASDASRHVVSWDWSTNQMKNYNLSSNFCQLSILENLKSSIVSRYVSVTLHDGSVELLKPNVEGKLGKPVHRIVVFEPGTSSVVPVFASCFTSTSVVIFFGMFPEFVCVEPINIQSLKTDSDFVLEKADPRNRLPTTEESVTNVVQPSKTSKAKKSTVASMQVHSTVLKEPSLIDLLNKTGNSSLVGTVSKNSKQSGEKKLTAGSRVLKQEGQSKSLLLLQCLSSNDSSKVNEIIAQRNPLIIRETVRNLNAEQVGVLVEYLFKNIDKANSSQSYPWIREILFVHFQTLKKNNSIRTHIDRMRQLTSNNDHMNLKLKNLKTMLSVSLLQKLRVDQDDAPKVETSVYADEEEESAEEAIGEVKQAKVTQKSPVRQHFGNRVSNVKQSFSINELKPDKSLLDISDVKVSSKDNADDYDNRDKGGSSDLDSDSDESMSE